jgi:hypothetical protein
MNVDAAKARHVEHWLWQNQTVGCDNDHLGTRSTNPVLCRGILQRWRLENLDLCG